MSDSSFDVPQGAVAQVSIIDSTHRLDNMPTSVMLTPAVDGFGIFPTLPTWSFLVQSSTGQKVLFDLGVPPNWTESFAPRIVKRIKDNGWDPKAEKHVADILEENGIKRTEIDSVIWSHWHWDHIGDVSTFPHAVELVVGPGFKEAFLPAYPDNPDSPLRQSHFEGRNVREIDFSQQQPQLKIGAFQAFDFFGDGSFYLLETPGHAIGHLSGLARTTENPDTFIMMGGDLCHHSGEIRPSSFIPIPPQVQFPLPEAIKSLIPSCPGGKLFEEVNVKRGRKPDEPFFDPAMGHDIAQTIQTIKDAQVADARDDIFFVFAHDPSIGSEVDLFPKTANQWKEKGWRERTFWKFLADLASAAVKQ